MALKIGEILLMTWVMLAFYFFVAYSHKLANAKKVTQKMSLIYEEV